MHSLILGGYHSGKTEQAFKLISNNNDKINYITTKPLVEKLNYRMNIIECYDNLANQIDILNGTIIIDDIAFYYRSLIENYFNSLGETKDSLKTIEESIVIKRDNLIKSILNYHDDIIIISSVVGLGLIPPTKQERIFRDELGFFNQALAANCQRVEMLIAGIATTIKNKPFNDNIKSKGILYGVSVGPGNEEMITLEALKILNQTTVLAVPETKSKNTVSLNIISNIVNITNKTIIPIFFSMSYDLKKCEDNYKNVAEKICKLLDQGNDVAMPILGDIAIYSTFANFSSIVEDLGYTVKTISGVPSFIAAADAFNLNLVKGTQSLTILSCSDPMLKEKLKREGKKIIMKIGKQLGFLKALLIELNLQEHVHVAINIGMKNQRLVSDISSLGDDEGYFALVIVD